MAVRILTDSACDLPETLRKDYGVDVLPLHVMCEDGEYLDGVDIQPGEMLQKMRHGKVYKTAQVSPGMFRETLEQYAKSGDSCVYIGFSSGLSATYQSGVLAINELLESYPGFQVAAIDTKCASLGQGLVVYQAARMAEAGKKQEEIAAAAARLARQMEHIFTVDDLEYLYRGGRVSRAAAMVGGILNIKPVLHVDDGKLVPIEKIRGRSKAMKRMVELMAARGTDLANQVIGISHGDDLDAAEKLSALIQKEHGCKEFVVNTIGCAIGAHSGPGTLSVFFLNRGRT